ncbi:endo-1,4-beta-xylanase [Marinoscillum pacificum]|uniref:endo-1,4-beta-xylanase n=1 Tax=Marinoscillum pacificum TaxID=392723 RepID=UPI002157CFC0|nr:endo-1,4-beta-xylanase [Marinoscillum pacificum]
MSFMKYMLLSLIILWVSACSSPKNQEKSTVVESSTKGLKDYYAQYFPVGVAVYPEALKGGPEAELIKRHFVSMTPENVMKMGPIHPKEDEYNWSSADDIVEFAKENELKMRGHALCWHNQVPDWIFTNDENQYVSKEMLLERLKNHIMTVVSRYKGSVYAWDVVNEAISDSKDEFYRNTKWYEICGEEFIAKAFEYAHQADPNADLFYNDYEVINPVKREKIYQLVKKLKDSGVPITGIGIQGHWSIYEPTEETLRETIEKFTSLGLKVQITELDVSVYPKEHTLREKLESDSDQFTEEQKELQIKQYEMIFKVFREYKQDLNAVTFWNISDKYSWLDHFPVPDRKDYPLLFDQNHQPKEAYYHVIDF